MSKELTIDNGDVTDADKTCEHCDYHGLLPSYEYCPYCGEQL